MAGERQAPWIGCTECRRGFQPSEGIYGYLCPHCRSPQDSRSPLFGRRVDQVHPLLEGSGLCDVPGCMCEKHHVNRKDVPAFVAMLNKGRPA